MSENELATVEQNPMRLLMTLAERGGDIAIMEKCMDLQERWERNNAARGYAQALADFQSKCPPIHKSRSASFGGKQAYSYASLEDIMGTIQPILHECGLSVSFSTRMVDGMIEATCTLRHGIHAEPHTVTLPLPSDMRVNDTQKAGAALSYAKRYSVCGALNVVVTDEDDDAGGLAQTITEEQAIVIGEMLDTIGEGNGKFLAWAGIDRVADLPAARHDEIMGMLRAKLAKRSKA